MLEELAALGPELLSLLWSLGKLVLAQSAENRRAVMDAAMAAAEAEVVRREFPG